MRRLTLGSWDLPPLPLDEALRSRAAASRIALSPPQTATCPPLDSHCDPAGRGLVDGLLTSRAVSVEGTNILVFSEASLFGGRLIATADDRLYADYELSAQSMDTLLAGAGDIKTTEHQIIQDGDRYSSAALSQDPIRLDGVHALLTSSEPINYGAWLIRVFPKIHNLRQVGAFETGRMLCFIDRPWQTSLLGWMGVSLDRVVHQRLDQHYRVETLVVPTWPSRGKFLDAGILAYIAQTRQRVLREAGPSPGKMIYVSRLGWRGAAEPGATTIRAFAQEAELIDRLAALGIEGFSPEEHDFAETLEVFSKARFVIGPQGSGLFNAIFCRPGTPVVEIAHLPYFARGHANLFLSAGLRYMVVVGADPELGQHGAHAIHRALTIDMERTVAFVARQLDALVALEDEDDRMMDGASAQRPRRAAALIAGLREDAVAATAASDFARAAEAWGELRRIAPDCIDGFLAGAAALAALGRHSEAQALLASALDRFPGNDALLLARARSFSGQALWPQAEAAWSALHARRPSQSGPLLELVQALVHQGKWDAAEAALGAGCARDEAPLDLLSAQAELAGRRQDWPLADQRWQALRRRFPDHPSAWCGQIVTLLRRDDRAAAEALSAEAAERFPGEPAVLNLHARAAVAALDWARAEQRWAGLRQIEPADANACLQQAIALRGLRRAADAEALLAEAATLFPDDAPIAKLRRLWQMRARMP